MTKLKEIRLARGMSQSQLAKTCGISKRTLQEYEQGRRGVNGASCIKIFKIATALNCEIEDLLEIEQEAEIKK